MRALGLFLAALYSPLDRQLQYCVPRIGDALVERLESRRDDRLIPAAARTRRVLERTDRVADLKAAAG